MNLCKKLKKEQLVMNNSYNYPGSELELFENAFHWKRYLAEKITPFLKNDVLEVGAGLGATSRILNNCQANKWTLLEPDEKMFQFLKHNQRTFHTNTEFICGTIQDLKNEKYNTVLYIDVLEHIENDHQEINEIAKHIHLGGYLIILSPAFNFLFSEFDSSIGHYRRYTKKLLRNTIPANFDVVSLKYLDAAGFFASIANKYLLHQSYPTKKQIMFWDNFLVPISKLVDPFFGYSFGKSILGIWKKKTDEFIK